MLNDPGTRWHMVEKGGGLKLDGENARIGPILLAR